jgi:hypothetical protein
LGGYAVSAPRSRFAELTYGQALALVTVAGAVFRLALLARQQLGIDEDFTAAVVSKPLGEMLGAVGRDSAPPLFYIAEWLVAQAWQGPAGLRLVPAAAGIALIPLVAGLARRVAGDSAGLWAAALVAFLPATLLGAENARMYSAAGAVVVAATLLVWRALERPSGRRWIAYTSIAAAAIWVDYFSAVALTGVVVAVVWLRPERQRLMVAILATAAAFASVGPWLLLSASQIAHAGDSFWIPPLSPGSVAGTFGQLFAGPPVDPGVPGRDALVALQVLAVVAGSMALVAVAVGWRRLQPEARRATTFLLVACCGVAALAAVSIWRPLLEARYAGVMWLPLFALAGVGLASVPRRVAAAALVALAVPSLALGFTPTHPETASLLPEIESRVGADDLVAADADHYLLLLGSGDAAVRARLHIFAAEDPPWYFGTAAYAAGAVIHSVPASVVADGGSIFWVADPGAAPPSLPAGYHSLETRCVVLACLDVYGPPGG